MRDLRACYWLPDDGLHPFRRGFAGVAQVDLVVFSPQLVTVFLDVSMESLNGWAFLGVWAYVHDLG